MKSIFSMSPYMYTRIEQETAVVYVYYTIIRCILATINTHTNVHSFGFKSTITKLINRRNKYSRYLKCAQYNLPFILKFAR